jgi:hypothetical protein
MTQRKLRYVCSQRKFASPPSFKIVEEWEDVISKFLEKGIKYDNKYLRKLIYRLDKLIFSNILCKAIPKRRSLKLRFEMDARNTKSLIIDKNTIPVIIDFWYKREDLQNFYEAYKHVPLVLVSSLEVFNFLKSNNCPLIIEHWPLSLPDKYIKTKLNDKIEKEFDFCFIGRPDPYFIEFIERFSEENPSFNYIQNNNDINDRKYFSNKGEFICSDQGRSTYLEIIRKSKISCYSTPGVDSSKTITETYNQLTPRYLELTAGGCYILCRYADNDDVRYYEMNLNNINITSYQVFKKQLTFYLNSKPRDINECFNYLQKHTTSSRIGILKNILFKYKINI